LQARIRGAHPTSVLPVIQDQPRTEHISEMPTTRSCGLLDPGAFIVTDLVKLPTTRLLARGDGKSVLALYSKSIVDSGTIPVQPDPLADRTCLENLNSREVCVAPTEIAGGRDSSQRA
jgi:hypothetical protein